MGDMRGSRKNREAFSRKLGLAAPPALAEQVHGNISRLIGQVTDDVVAGVDGLVSRDIPLAVVAADCVPILLIDPYIHVCATVHAGWKGTLGGITLKTIGQMVACGARVEAIVACIGPHIGMCCYDVVQERAKAFMDRFGADQKLAARVNGKWHLDIGLANYRQLLDAGLATNHIDAALMCTSCQNDTFFSYRKDTKDTYGEIMGVVGFR